jgi:hypothetical protein
VILFSVAMSMSDDGVSLRLSDTAPSFSVFEWGQKLVKPTLLNALEGFSLVQLVAGPNGFGAALAGKLTFVANSHTQTSIY